MMNINEFYADPNEQPLDRMVADGGFCGIFRTIGCIGDSLASGELESLDDQGKHGFHDLYDYSWGQYLARMCGSRAINFSRGGMTAKVFWESFGESCGCWSEENACQAYIIALGVNDQKGIATGSAADIDVEHPENCKETFAGYLGRIILRLKSLQPKARFFLVTRPNEETDAERRAHIIQHHRLMHELAALFDYTYVIDLLTYGPVYGEEFKKTFFLGGHMNPAGYLLTARMFASYIDYIIRNKPDDFTQIGFVGTPYHNVSYKW
ncbi:MAG: SGNH/GDSL hydrolase family protein [Clostridia bacterium]|nr:SGNH/GDSL hydrolase family protein [Clostridia bacterium]